MIHFQVPVSTAGRAVSAGCSWCLETTRVSVPGCEPGCTGGVENVLLLAAPAEQDVCKEVYELCFSKLVMTY